MALWALAIALIFLAIGYYIGREAGKAPKATRCVKCGQRRLFYCRGCGIHFDDEDNAIPPREYDRLTSAEALFGGADEDSKER